MSNEGNVSYPAVYDNVIGVRAGILEKERGFWFHEGEPIQCIMDCVTPVVAVPQNKYIMIPSCNSIAAARLTGIVGKLLWEKRPIRFVIKLYVTGYRIKPCEMNGERTRFTQDSEFRKSVIGL